MGGLHEPRLGFVRFLWKGFTGHGLEKMIPCPHFRKIPTVWVAWVSEMGCVIVGCTQRGGVRPRRIRRPEPSSILCDLRNHRLCLMSKPSDSRPDCSARFFSSIWCCRSLVVCEKEKLIPCPHFRKIPTVWVAWISGMGCVIVGCAHCGGVRPRRIRQLDRQEKVANNTRLRNKRCGVCTRVSNFFVHLLSLSLSSPQFGSVFCRSSEKMIPSVRV